MSWNSPSVVGLAAAGFVAIGLTIVAARFAIFFAPYAWTGEPDRLATVLALRPGMRIADIGAGSGELAAAMGSFVGSSGQVYATEIDPERRAAIEQRVHRSGASNLRVVAAAETETNLPDRCCDAIYMRAMFHHVADKAAFAASVAKALRPGGRVAVIDFAPGTLWFHAADHGVAPEAVVRAFTAAGCRIRARQDDWGGGMFLLLFDGGAGPAQ